MTGRVHERARPGSDEARPDPSSGDLTLIDQCENLHKVICTNPHFAHLKSELFPSSLLHLSLHTPALTTSPLPIVLIPVEVFLPSPPTTVDGTSPAVSVYLFAPRRTGGRERGLTSGPGGPD
jgi:hypothetical protein